MAVRFGLRDPHPHKKAGRKSHFSPEGKVALMFLKAYSGLSAPKLMEQLNANIHYQLFCGIRICSRNPSPTKFDSMIVAKLTQAAESVRMTLRDHIILADEQYYSFKDNKKL